MAKVCLMPLGEAQKLVMARLFRFHGGNSIQIRRWPGENARSSVFTERHSCAPIIAALFHTQQMEVKPAEHPCILGLDPSADK